MKVRTIKLIKKLLSSSYPININVLSNYFDVSSRTIQNLISEANEYLVDLNLKEIKNIRGKGLLLEASPDEKQQIVMTIFQDGFFYLEKEERELDLLLSIAFSKEPVFLNKKELEYLVSKSTIDEDMRRLRKKLLKYDIEIVSNGKQGYLLVGSERSIRTMLFDVINKEVGPIELLDEFSTQLSINQHILNKYIEKKDIIFLSQILNLFFKEMDDELYKKQIYLFSLIWIYRLKKGESIGLISWSKTSESIDSVEIDDYISSIVRCFDIEVSHIEIEYLKFIIMSLNTADLDNSVNWVNAQIITISLMKFVEDETGIPFHKKEESLYESLYEHIFSMISRVQNGVQVFNPILTSIKSNYFEIFEAVKKFTPTIEEVIGVKISESEISFLAIHFSTIYTYLREEKSLVFKSVVICNHGVATSNLLAASLKKWFPEIDVVAIMGSQDMSLIEKLDVDLIFSTYSVDIKSKPLMVVEPIITEENSDYIQKFLEEHNQYGRLKISNSDYTGMFNELISLVNKSSQSVDIKDYNKLQELFKKNGLKINLEEIQPMLRDKLSDGHIIMDGIAETWEEAIELVSVPLLEEKIIKEDYVKAMIASVKKNGPYIVIGKNLALAHARPEDGVNDLGISVVKLKNPVEFGNEEMDPVSLVFCLAATDSYSHLNIMKELVYLINDEERLEKLILSDSKDQFKQILFGK